MYEASSHVLIRFVQNRRQNGGLSMPSMVTSSWFSASWPMPPIIPPGKRLVDDRGHAVHPARIGARRGRLSLREQAITPAARLEHEIAARVQRPRRPVEAMVLEPAPRLIGVIDRGAAERRAAHADGVDLVDEDDALAAPLGGELLRLPRHVAHDQRVDADEGLREARAGDGDER